MRRVVGPALAVLGVLALAGLIVLVQGGTSAAPVATLVGADVPDRPAPVAELEPVAPASVVVPRAPLPVCPVPREKDAACPVPEVAPTSTAAPEPDQERDDDASCAELRARGAGSNFRPGSVFYTLDRDEDRDGIACESS